MSLEDSATVVTGASSGIGEATAHELASRGAQVALAARSEDRLTAIADDLEREYGAETLVVPTDVRDEAAVEDLIETAVDAFGGLDVLVNNAGLGRGGEGFVVVGPQVAAEPRDRGSGHYRLGGCHAPERVGRSIP